MVKIKISYEQPEELAEIIKRLHYSGEIKHRDKGAYKRAFLTISDSQKKQFML